MKIFLLGFIGFGVKATTGYFYRAMDSWNPEKPELKAWSQYSNSDMIEKINAIMEKQGQTKNNNNKRATRRSRRFRNMQQKMFARHHKHAGS